MVLLLFLPEPSNKNMKYWILLLAYPFSELAFAHGGGLNAQGCHNNRKAGSYHCHRSASKPRAALSSGLSPGKSSRVFRNCSEARAAGAAPVLRGSAGYGKHLDRDNDGVGCE